jgi:hypothetical protein
VVPPQVLIVEFGLSISSSAKAVSDVVRELLLPLLHQALVMLGDDESVQRLVVAVTVLGRGEEFCLLEGLDVHEVEVPPRAPKSPRRPARISV